MKRPWQPTEDQLLCRDLQHSWSPYTARRLAKRAGFLRTLKCVRCGSLKDQTLSNDGFIMRSRMAYPDGYLRPNEGRLTRMDRAALRVRNMTS